MSCWQASVSAVLLCFWTILHMISNTMCEQGPAWEAQCHADTHLMLSTLQSLPLDPKTAPSNMEHLANLCMLRFADPSPSGYTIPGQLPSPVSYSSATQAPNPGTANSLAMANGVSPPSLGQQLEQVRALKCCLLSCL